MAPARRRPCPMLRIPTGATSPLVYRLTETSSSAQSLGERVEQFLVNTLAAASSELFLSITWLVLTPCAAPWPFAML